MKKEFKTEIEIEDKKYNLCFDLNVMEEIQEEYGTFDKWGELTDGEKGEVNVKALIFGVTAMLNEGIDIENEENKDNKDYIKKEFFTKKQVGRLMTKLGISEMAGKMNEAVVKSVKSEQKN